MMSAKWGQRVGPSSFYKLAPGSLKINGTATPRDGGVSLLGTSARPLIVFKRGNSNQSVSSATAVNDDQVET
jgi:hypothetical protein